MSAKNYASRNIRGKLKVCRYMAADSRLKSLVPTTVSFTRSNLDMMAGRFRTLYIKPDVGSLGIGIFKLKREDKGYTLKETAGRRQKKHRLADTGEAFDRIAQSGKRKLIVQQGITLDRVNGRPYDVRAMVQRKPGGPWTCTGFLVKVGAAGKIVTNYYQGGSIYSLRKLHSELGLGEEAKAERERKLTAAALDIARSLSKRRSGMHEMGIDFAFDDNGRLWVLEVNSNHPQFHPLRSIDPSAYNRMKRFAAAYGRHSAK